MSSPESKTSLLIFAKAPILGTVKTRMQPQLSEEGCLRLHEALLKHTLGKVEACELPGLSKAFFFTDTGSEVRKRIRELCIPSSISIEFQVGRDLGERMTHALNKRWEEGFRKIVFVGTDSPLLGTQDIRAALEGLRKHEIVISPTTDGGYCLIGFSALKAVVLAGIDWGTSRVYEQTMRLLKAHSIRWQALKETFDLDTFDDLVRFHRMLSSAQELRDSSFQELFSQVDSLMGIRSTQ
jgi:rSAM/selenodomain-associated transferase 1